MNLGSAFEIFVCSLRVAGLSERHGCFLHVTVACSYTVTLKTTVCLASLWLKESRWG